MANKIGIGVEVDDGGAVKKISGISKAFDKLGGKGSGASLFGNVGAAAVAKGFGLIDDAISGTIGFLEDSVKKFNEDAQSQALLANALQNNVAGWKFSQKAVDDYVDSQINLGFVDDDVRASISQLIGVTHDATKAQELNTLAQDLARAKNIDLATATDIVTKAHEGNFKALKTLGIQIPKNSTATQALDIIQQNVKGSADAWANTTAGKLQIAQDKFSEAQEKLGGTIMPILSDIMIKFTDDWLPALGRGWQKVTDFMKPVLKVLGDIIGAIGTAIGKIQDFLNWAAKVGGVSQDQFYHPKAPGHAAGGWVGLNGPEMAIVGERGPEYIVPNHALGSHGPGVRIEGLSEKQILDMVDRGLYFKLRRASLSSSA